MICMGSSSIDLQASVEDTFPKIQQRIGTSGFEIKSVVPNQTIIAEGGREFKWSWMILFIILLWPAAIIYYFTRKMSSVSITITPSKEVGCKVIITSNGIKGDQVMQMIVDILK
ncbi:MAG TPA: hypothetical protein VD699_01320 [Nitrosopumilaceae archaeon]|nr:hypothetical protein [Nitrosopumilaceae archaeon]